METFNPAPAGLSGVDRQQPNIFLDAMRASRVAMVLVDAEGYDQPIVFANEAFLRLTGYTREEVEGQNCRFMQGPGTDREAIDAIRCALAEHRPLAIDLLNYRKDGSSFWNSLSISPVMGSDGRTRYYYASQEDASVRRHAEMESHALRHDLEGVIQSRTAELQEALKRSTGLVHEVDHRVKNNLQMISAILMLQSMSVADFAVKNALQEMLERVDALGLVHKRLYQSRDTQNFNIAEFTKEIAGNLMMASGRNDIDLDLDIEPVMIGANEAAPMALVVNEIITSALRRAFPAGQGGRLHVGVRPIGDAFEIAVGDSGGAIGASASPGFGKTLVETLIRQLNARIDTSVQPQGSAVRITMPMRETAQASTRL